VPAVRDEGICLRHWDWSETSQTISLFGRSLGLIRGLAKGARRERGNFGGGIDLLSRGEFGAIMKSGTELATLTDWELLETYPALRENLPRNRAAYYAADLVQRMVAPSDPHPGLYDALVTLLQTLGEGSRGIPGGASTGPRGAHGTDDASAPPGPENARLALGLLRFQWRLLEETGLQPSLDVDAEGAGETFWFDARGGVLSSKAPEHGWRVRRSTIDIIRAVAASSAPTAPTAPSMAADAEAIDRANRFLAAYVREIIQTEPPTLRDLFGNLGVPSIRPS